MRTARTTATPTRTSIAVPRSDRVAFIGPSPPCDPGRLTSSEQTRDVVLYRTMTVCAVRCNCKLKSLSADCRAWLLDQPVCGEYAVLSRRRRGGPTESDCPASAAGKRATSPTRAGGADHRAGRGRPRKQLLGQADPPEISVVLEEYVLRRPVGGRVVMREQLGHLVSAVPATVILQILPVGVGEHPAMSGAFTIYSFAEPDDPDVVYLE